MRNYIRDVALFAAGVVAALVFLGPGQAQDSRLTGLHINHAGIVAKDWQSTLDFYIKTLGFREAFTFKDKDDNVTTSYLQISKNDFLDSAHAAERARRESRGHLGG